jgi:hypothetical protein
MKRRPSKLLKGAKTMSYTKTHDAKLVNPEKSQGLTRSRTGLTRLSTGMRVRTHIKAGPIYLDCSPQTGGSA